MARATPARRPVAARQSGAVRDLAREIARLGLRPNQVSVASVVLSALAGACIVAGAHVHGSAGRALLLAGALLIPVRLLCNVLDGLLAVEGGLRTPSGAVFNELPDRLSDLILCVCAGYAAGGPWGMALGWSAGSLAVLTAYVRALAGSLGAHEDFGGPMAKQQRMWTLAFAAAVAATLPADVGTLFLWTLGVIAAGCAVTIALRTLHLIRELETRR
jgi:phosphatidylglycerophosphate synthase